MTRESSGQEYNRLSEIYTKTGDKGTTSLGDQRRVSKTHCRIEAIGSVDELNTWMALLIGCSLGLIADSAIK